MVTQETSEQVIRQLYQVTQGIDRGFEYQVIELLRVGLERFRLDIGILSTVADNTYTVQYCVTPPAISLSAGDTFDLGATYCSITCQANGPTALECVGEDEKYAVHPAYEAFGLEAYLGIPIHFKGKLYGTLNFSSPVPYPRKFSDVDIDALQLMASWIEAELIRRDQEAQLNSLNQELDILANYDSLTKIPNQQGIMRELHKGLNQLNRSQGKGTIALVMINDFEALHNKYGRHISDQALIDTAKQLTESLRNYDAVARIASETFLLWLPNTDTQAYTIICKRINATIAKIAITPSPITVSIGASHFHFKHQGPEDLEALLDELMYHAEEALCIAKNNDKDQHISSSETIVLPPSL